MDIPPHAVLCFFQDVIEKVVGGARRHHRRPRGLRDRPQPDLRARHRRAQAGARAPRRRRAARRRVPGGVDRARMPDVRRVRRRGGAGPRRRAGPRDRPDRRDPGRGHLVPLPARRDGRSSPRLEAVDAIVATLEHHHVPLRDGQDVDDGRPLPGDARQGRAPRRGGMPDGRDGGGGVLRGRGVPRGDVRAAALRGRRSVGRRVGQPRDGTPTPPAGNSCSAWRPRRACRSRPASARSRFGILRA